MGTFFGFIGHVVAAMIKGFVFTGVVAAIIAFGALLVTSPSHSLAAGITTVFAAVIAVLAGILGSAVALVYHLSHIEEVTHAVRRAQELRAEQRQAAGRK